MVDNPVYLRFSPTGLARPRSAAGVERLQWNSAVASVMQFPGYATAETCERLVELSQAFPAEPGRMFDGVGKRRNKVRLLAYRRETRWAFNLMASLFDHANQRFNFHLSGLAEPVHTIEYGHDDHIDWHTDCGLRQTSTRKLVATILLTPPEQFDGGELELAAVEASGEARAIGDAMVFPAFLPHRVRPVTRGRRVVLAAWAHGPVFQ